jgi:hypothetical protein
VGQAHLQQILELKHATFVYQGLSLQKVLQSVKNVKQVNFLGVNLAHASYVVLEPIRKLVLQIANIVLLEQFQPHLEVRHVHHA